VNGRFVEEGANYARALYARHQQEENDEESLFWTLLRWAFGNFAATYDSLPRATSPMYVSSWEVSSSGSSQEGRLLTTIDKQKNC